MNMKTALPIVAVGLATFAALYFLMRKSPIVASKPIAGIQPMYDPMSDPGNLWA